MKLFMTEALTLKAWWSSGKVSAKRKVVCANPTRTSLNLLHLGAEVFNLFARPVVQGWRHEFEGGGGRGHIALCKD